MSDDFQRLIDGSLDARVRQVLGAGLDDRPSPERIRSAAAALGLSAGTAALAQASAPVGAAAAAAKPGMALVVLKWLGIGALLGGVTATASVAVLSPGGTTTAARHAVTPARVVAQAPARHTRTVVAAKTPDENAAPEPARADVESAEPAPSSSAAAPEASVAGFDAAPADTLHEEIALLDQARHALRAGDAAAALSALDHYQAAASKHALATEALLLRVRALVKAGRGSEADALGRSYIARHPHDGYAERIRHLLGIRAPSGQAPAPGTPRPAATTVAPSSPPPATKVPTASF